MVYAVGLRCVLYYDSVVRCCFAVLVLRVLLV